MKLASIGQWIETVREKPEHVRKRYVLICVVNSMVIVIGLWLVTVSESFKQVADDATQGVETGRDILRPSQETLEQFLNSKERLGDREGETTGQEFIERELETRAQPIIGDEGLRPKTEAERELGR